MGRGAAWSQWGSPCTETVYCTATRSSIARRTTSSIGGRRVRPNQPLLRSARASHQWPQQPLEPVGFDLVHRGQHYAELAGRVALSTKPEDLRFREFEQETAAVLPEGHARVGELDEICVVCGGVAREVGVGGDRYSSRISSSGRPVYRAMSAALRPAPLSTPSPTRRSSSRPFSFAS